MATTTTPEVKTAPISLTANAVSKVKEIMGQQNPTPAGLRVGVVGGGCSGFSYSMSFENGVRGCHVAHVPEWLHRGLHRDARRSRV